MRALDEREKRNFNNARKNAELLVVEPPRQLFKIVVNNYKKQEIILNNKKKTEEIVETMMTDQQGLPPQPTGYLKFPEHDWF